MQNATHIYSGAKGIIIGYNARKKAHLISLSTGQQQYWRDNAMIKDSKLEESKIVLRLIKNSNLIERYFNKEEEAHQYLTELKSLNDISNICKKGFSAMISNGWRIESNYDLRSILNSKYEVSSIDLGKALSRTIKIPSTYKPISPDTIQANPRAKKKSNGEMVKLQDLTNDSRKARVILRGLVRAKKISKPGRWEWEVGSADLETVKKALNK